ncbi:oligoribonuclease [Mycobacterium xenopi 4042]|uniref:Oligoribonuclease n=1 Tax=Mycobacterium xenopi 4042 TaxID=1299334 RepID=X7YXD3_MYCXE|nr:oligoribonuclease [Mycobacterium xenopi 4042]
MRDELVWIDCEMTGLDLRSDKLIEIAALVTDGELNILGEGIDVVIHADDAALSSMIEVVTDMHARRALSTRYGRQQSTWPPPKPWCSTTSASTSSSQNRARRQFGCHRPRVHRPRHACLGLFLHYRMIDVSTIKELCRRWYPRIYYGQPTKG